MIHYVSDDVRYGLLYQGGLLHVHCLPSPPDAHFCNPDQHLLTEDIEAPFWIVATREKAVYVANTDTGWFNSVYERPSNPYVNRCQVANIRMILSTETETEEEKKEDMISQLTEARILINQAVELMTTDQLSQWQGVHAWLESPANNAMNGDQSPPA